MSPHPPPNPQLAPHQQRQLDRWQRWLDRDDATDTPPQAPSQKRSQRAIAWVLGGWSLCLLLAIVALWRLCDPDATQIQQQHRAQLSRWTVATIVVGCAGGSVLLGRWLDARRSQSLGDRDAEKSRPEKSRLE